MYAPPQKLSEPLLAAVASDGLVSFRGVLFLAITILMEVSGTVLLKHAIYDPRMLVMAYALYFAGFSMFAVTLRSVPLSVAYTTWCAAGTVGVSIASRLVYQEEISPYRWVCIMCTIPFTVGMYVLP